MTQYDDINTSVAQGQALCWPNARFPLNLLLSRMAEIITTNAVRRVVSADERHEFLAEGWPGGRPTFEEAQILMVETLGGAVWIAPNLTTSDVGTIPATGGTGLSWRLLPNESRMASAIDIPAVNGLLTGGTTLAALIPPTGAYGSPVNPSGVTWDTVNRRFVIPAGGDGDYLISGQARFTIEGTGTPTYGGIGLRVNSEALTDAVYNMHGGVVAALPLSQTMSIEAQGIRRLVAGDTVTPYYICIGPATLSIRYGGTVNSALGLNQRASFAIHRLRAI